MAISFPQTRGLYPASPVSCWHATTYARMHVGCTIRKHVHLNERRKWHTNCMKFRDQADLIKTNTHTPLHCPLKHCYTPVLFLCIWRKAANSAFHSQRKGSGLNLLVFINSKMLSSTQQRCSYLMHSNRFNTTDLVKNYRASAGYWTSYVDVLKRRRADCCVINMRLVLFLVL